MVHVIVLVLQLLLLILVTILFQRCFLHRLQRLSTLQSNLIDINRFLFLCQLATSVLTVVKHKKKIKIWKRKKRNVLIPARLHAPIKNTNLESIKLTVQSISLGIPETSEIEQI